MTNQYIRDGIERLRSKWPQSHAVKGKYGEHLIIVPSVKLPAGYLTDLGFMTGTPATICTILFIAPPGFPAACPSDFFTDIDLRLAKNKPGDFMKVPHHSQPSFMSNARYLLREWPQWTTCHWWKLRLQAWNPNSCSLFTYANVIRQRLEYVR